MSTFNDELDKNLFSSCKDDKEVLMRGFAAILIEMNTIKSQLYTIEDSLRKVRTNQGL